MSSDTVRGAIYAEPHYLLSKLLDHSCAAAAPQDQQPGVADRLANNVEWPGRRVAEKELYGKSF